MGVLFIFTKMNSSLFLIGDLNGAGHSSNFFQTANSCSLALINYIYIKYCFFLIKELPFSKLIPDSSPYTAISLHSSLYSVYKCNFFHSIQLFYPYCNEITHSLVSLLSTNHIGWIIIFIHISTPQLNSFGRQFSFFGF